MQLLLLYALPRTEIACTPCLGSVDIANRGPIVGFLHDLRQASSIVS